MDLASAIGSSQRRGDDRPWVVARLLDINPTTGRAQVSIDGSEAVWLPYNLAGTYTNVTTVFVQRDPYNTGAGAYVVGPNFVIPNAPPPVVPPTPPPSTPKTVTDTALIRPSWSGTFRSGGPVPGYGQWNANRYGGRSTLWQGNQYGSGPLLGIATYGTQVRDLDAISIDRIVVYTPLITGSGDVALRQTAQGGTLSGTTAPAPAGPTASGGQAVELASSVREDFRTGAARGLVSVGSSYRATGGTSNARGMALAITYTRAA